jgi:integrase
VLTRSDGRYGREGERITYNVAKGWLIAAHKRAELELHGVHTLRHTFCSHLAMAGAPVTAIRDLAGHSSVAITQRYMHLAPAAIMARSISWRLPQVALGATSSLEKGRRREPAREKN